MKVESDREVHVELCADDSLGRLEVNYLLCERSILWPLPDNHEAFDVFGFQFLALVDGIECINKRAYRRRAGCEFRRYIQGSFKLRKGTLHSCKVHRPSGAPQVARHQTAHTLNNV